MSNTKKESKHFWITRDLFDDIKKIQHEFQDERVALTIRRLLRSAIDARAEKKGNTHG